MSKTNDHSRQALDQSHKGFRRLDHLGNIQEGIGFTAVPDILTDAYLDNRIPGAKFKLILVMLRHSAKFKIKRSYLDSRFGQDTLQKYLPEIESDGFIRREISEKANGSREVTYHTNRVEFWNIPSKKPDHPPTQEAPGEEAPGQEYLKKTKGKKTKEKKTNSMDGCKSKVKAKAESPIPKPKPPTHKPDIVDLSKRFESIFTPGFINFPENNDWFKRLADHHGHKRASNFVEWSEKKLGRGRYPFSIHNRGLLYQDWLIEERPYRDLKD